MTHPEDIPCLILRRIYSGLHLSFPLVLNRKMQSPDFIMQIPNYYAFNWQLSQNICQWEFWKPKIQKYWLVKTSREMSWWIHYWKILCEAPLSSPRVSQRNYWFFFCLQLLVSKDKQIHQGVVNLLPKGAFFRLRECLESSFCIYTSTVFPAYIMYAFCENSSRKEIFKEDTEIPPTFPASCPHRDPWRLSCLFLQKCFPVECRAVSAWFRLTYIFSETRFE